MADTKNTQTAPAGLPEKEWFTLDEVAARWGTDKETILHYAETNLLTIFADLRAIKSLKGNFISNGGMMYSIEPHEAGVIEVQGSIKTPNGNGVIERQSLRVLHGEVDRFEQKHRIGAYAGTMPDLSAKTKAKEDTEIRQLQRTLGALVLGLAKSSDKYDNNGLPNVSSIVGVAEQGGQDKGGKAPHGWGNTTFTNTINAALLVCQKELDR